MADDLTPPLTAEQRLRDNFLTDLAEVMKSASGRRLIWHLISAPEWGGSFRYLDARAVGAMPRGEQDALAGQRALGMQLNQTAMAVADHDYLVMFREARGLLVQYQLDEMKAAQQKKG